MSAAAQDTVGSSLPSVWAGHPEDTPAAHSTGARELRRSIVPGFSTYHHCGNEALGNARDRGDFKEVFAPDLEDAIRGSLKRLRLGDERDEMIHNVDSGE